MFHGSVETRSSLIDNTDIRSQRISDRKLVPINVAYLGHAT
jgi:hypothetical protein